jgi:phosphoglycolate phosphatase-like HAD superfamily hydrolase
VRQTAVKAVVFDIDGTLITTGGAGARAWSLAFEDRYSVAGEIADYTEDGMPDHDVCRATFIGLLGREPTESEIAGLITAYLGHLDDAVGASDGYRVLPGLPAALEILGATGILLGITSGNVEAAAHIKLARGQLNRWFSFGGYGSDSPDRGELTRIAIQRGGRILGAPLDPAAVLVVGDTPRDVAAAHAAGAVSVGVATGHFTAAELSAAGADHVLTSLEDPLPC